MRPSLAALAALISTLALSPSATGEAWEVKAGLGPSFGTEASEQRKQGLGGQVYLDVGLSDFVSLSAAGGYVSHFFGPGLGYDLAHAGIGVTANLDVLIFGVGLAWVPYATARLGFLQVDTRDQAADPGFGLALGVGLDYIWDESYSMGFSLEYHGMLTDLDGLPAYLGISLRLGLRWLDW